MTAAIIPFHTSAESAWAAYQALNEEAAANPRLQFDREHRMRRAQAHETFTKLFARECDQRVEGGRL